MSDIIDESIYEKLLWGPFNVGSDIKTRRAIKQYDPFNDDELIIAITQFNLHN